MRAQTGLQSHIHCTHTHTCVMVARLFVCVCVYSSRASSHLIMRSMGQVRLVSVCILSNASNPQLASSADVVLPVCQPAYVYSREEEKKLNTCTHVLCAFSCVYSPSLFIGLDVGASEPRVVAYNQQREETKTKKYKKKGNMFKHIAHKTRSRSRSRERAHIICSSVACMWSTHQHTHMTWNDLCCGEARSGAAVATLGWGYVRCVCVFGFRPCVFVVVVVWLIVYV